MRHLVIFSALSLLSAVKSNAQSVLNVRAFEEDGTVMVLYDLYTTKTENLFYVTLKMSKDGGKEYTPIYETVGDANKNVRTGPEHTIIWHPSQLPTDSMTFKVEARSRRSEEQLANPNAEKALIHEAGVLTITKVVRLNADIEFTLSLRNTRDKNGLFIAANFNILDDKNQRYPNVVVSQDDKTGSAISCEPGATTRFKFRVVGVPESVTRFSKITFSLSEMPVRFSDVKIEQ